MPPGLNGNLFERIPMLLRIVLIAGGLALMIPESITDIIGIAIIIAVFVIQYGVAEKIGLISPRKPNA